MFEWEYEIWNWLTWFKSLTIHQFYNSLKQSKLYYLYLLKCDDNTWWLLPRLSIAAFEMVDHPCHKESINKCYYYRNLYQDKGEVYFLFLKENGEICKIQTFNWWWQNVQHACSMKHNHNFRNTFLRVYLDLICKKIAHWDKNLNCRARYVFVQSLIPSCTSFCYTAKKPAFMILLYHLLNRSNNTYLMVIVQTMLTKLLSCWLTCKIILHNIIELGVNLKSLHLY